MSCETLAGELGVSSTYFGPGASRPVVRGLGGDRVLVLQDGVASLDVSSLSQDHAVTLESVVSQQIEIVKGPAALLYGSGAAGGLINIVSNRVPMEPIAQPLSGAAEIRGDLATEERTGALSLDAGTGMLALHADYFRRETEDVRIPGFAHSRLFRQASLAQGEEPDATRHRLPNSASSSEGGAFGASLIGATARGGGSWSRHESRYGIPGEEEAFIDMKQDRYDTRFALDLDGPVTALRFSGTYNDYEHTEFEAPGEPGTIYMQDAYELRVSADHQLGAGWRGTFGLQYLDVDFEALGDEAFVPGSRTRTGSVFAFEERHFDRWTIELGARVERQQIDVDSVLGASSYDETAISLSTGALWKFTEQRSLALNLTRTQRNPQAAELYADGPHLAAQRYEIGNADLDRETALTADVSLRGWNETFDWTLSVYYNDYSNYVYASPTGDERDELPVFAYRQGRAELYGFEAELTVPLLRSETAQLDLRLASDYVRGRLDTGDNLPQMPPLRFGAGLHYERGAWHLGTEAFYYDRQNRISEHELPTDSFVLLDVDVSYRLTLARTSIFMFARGTNLLDEDARQHASPLKDIAPLPGRSLRVGVRAEF
jgi:iron complex outermembrane receptor protein